MLNLEDHPPDLRGVLEQALRTELAQAQAEDRAQLALVRPGVTLHQLDLDAHD